jgi:hypothetical protein
MRESHIIDVIPNDQTPEDDVEAAFYQWKESFEDSETPGHIRAFRIPLDEQGRASHSASGQVRLGTWPIDQYDFDTLCSKIMREYMLPSETMMAVRLIGTLTGKSGVRFNKIVTLQRPNTGQNALPAPVATKDSVAEITRAIQESNERMMRMVQEMGGNRGGDTQSELMRTVAMMSVLNKPMMDMVGPLLAAVAGRAPTGGGSIKETIETLMLVDKFMGRRGGAEGGGQSDWVQITNAVAGVAKPLLEMAAGKQAETLRTRRPVPVSPTAPPPPPVTAPVAPTPPPVTVVPGGVDLTRPSTIPVDTRVSHVNLETPTPQGGPMFAEQKKMVDALVDVAATGADPIAVANAFFEQTMLTLENESQYGQLASFIEGPAFLGTIALYNPAVHQHAPFFEALRTQVIKRIQDEDTAPLSEG